MQMDAGSVRVCLAVLSSLFATVFAGEDLNDDMMDPIILTDVPMTASRALFAGLFAILTAAGHYASTKYVMPTNIKMNFYLQNTSYFISALFACVALAKSAVSQTMITVPFYMINLVFPSTLINLITALLIKYQWVKHTNPYFVDQSGAGNNGPTAAEIAAVTSAVIGDATVTAVSTVMANHPTYKFATDVACAVLGKVSTAGQDGEIADATNKGHVKKLIDDLTTRGKELFAKGLATLNSTEKAEFVKIKEILKNLIYYFRCAVAAIL